MKRCHLTFAAPFAWSGFPPLLLGACGSITKGGKFLQNLNTRHISVQDSESWDFAPYLQHGWFCMPSAAPGLALFAACTEGIPNSSGKSTGSCDLLWRLWIILLSAAPRWRWVGGGGGGDSLQACQHRVKESWPFWSRGRITKRSEGQFAAVLAPGRGTEACAVISVRASALMCLSSNCFLALALRLKITSPSRQLIKRRESHSDWFSLNCQSKSSSRVLTKAPKKVLF